MAITTLKGDDSPKVKRGEVIEWETGLTWGSFSKPTEINRICRCHNTQHNTTVSYHLYAPLAQFLEPQKERLPYPWQSPVPRIGMSRPMTSGYLSASGFSRMGSWSRRKEISHDVPTLVQPCFPWKYSHTLLLILPITYFFICFCVCGLWPSYCEWHCAYFSYLEMWVYCQVWFGPSLRW
jgi:hypothetical protein